MLFSEILGLTHLKNHLCASAERGRIPHAQLFVGAHGSGTLPMAIAYARHILCALAPEAHRQACHLKFEKLAHPDVHFAFPVATNNQVKKHPVASHFLEEWRNFTATSPYGSLYQWYQLLGIENKQGKIGVDEASDIVKSLSLKSYEGGYKVMIIWCADKMNIGAANKLLKLIEEPPEKTVFILITEHEDQIIQTIRSRCQVLHFPPLGEEVIAKTLEEQRLCTASEAQKIAHQANGDFNKALQILHQDESEEQFEQWFITWVRTAFKSKGNKQAIRELLVWSENIAKTNRETQKKFLLYCLDFFRQALLYHYQAKQLVFIEPKTQGFQLEKFAPFIHGSNIVPIQQEVEKALYHIERNGNAKLIFTDLSIQLTRFLHRKEKA